MSVINKIPALHAPGEIGIDDAIERLGHGRFQILVMVAAGLVFAADAMEILLLSFLSVVLQALWELTVHQTALLTSIVFLGQFVGTLILGPLGDRIGRRPVFLLSAIIISIFGVATAFCNTFVQLVCVRMMVGFGVGGVTVAFDTLAELLPVKKRGQRLLLIDYFWTLGMLMVPIAAFVTLGTETIPEHENTDGWRHFVILCSIPAIVSTIMGYFLVPESPRWLLTQGRRNEAMAILQKGAMMNRKDPDELYPEGTVLRMEKPEASTVKDLFTPTWCWITIPLWVTWTGFAFLYYGNILLTTHIFSAFAVNSKIGDAYAFDYAAIFVSGTAEIFSITFAILIIDRLGRRSLQVVGYIAGGISVLILSTFYEFDGSRGALVVFAFSTRFFLKMGNITTWVATAEILSTEIRTTGHACANAMARAGGFAAPYLVHELRDPLVTGCFMFAVAMVTSAASSQLPETKGKALGMHVLNHNDVSIAIPHDLSLQNSMESKQQEPVIAID